MSTSPTHPSAADLAAATPEGRDRTVDALRAFSILVVVLGHWLMAAISRDAGGDLEIGNLLEVEPWARRLTWPLQIMPLFFLVGGYAGAASWTAATRTATPYGTWLAARLRRLLAPVAVMVVVASAAIAVAEALGADGELTDDARRLLGLPLWFLAVYVALVALTPAMVAADRRLGAAAAAGLAGGALVVDLLHRGAGLPVVGWGAFAFVWLLPGQLGVAWRSGRIRPTPAFGLAIAAAGLAGLIALTAWFDYGTSLVGAWGGDRSNTDPPSLAIVGAALLQIGLAWWTRPALARLVEGRRAWTVVIAANGIALTVFCWHLVAAAGLVLLASAGLFPLPEPATAGWWLLRPVWMVAGAALLAPLVALFSPIERRAITPFRPPGWRPSTPVAALAAGAVVAALTFIALHGLPG